ncbi:ATP-NAD kinase family protein [Facklamia miroungae]|uniref:Predicted polyphosphate-or ATP-dependent NAD kinase n=1 Tax=Facklamia miroungae TaxID=120956 RepID=A0A1G7TJY4_9LACT|nr:ATP-NAD kinase family protein [Facklamia miroungae]NKZ29813.1 ATP-NAD kinase family protein [Facklamia miroungae]SDG35412.1 Predicted polyphosphate-or ATP-dependent NAD kinase [Facklamia miroungae]
MKKLGIVVNPIAGMGGRVGLKGTDGEEVLSEAIKRGAKPEAPTKAVKALKELNPLKDELKVYVASDDMGENLVKKTELNYEVIHQIKHESNASDTIELVEKLHDLEVDLILFAGGDGTARDIASVTQLSIPTVGIPAGVKIHSPVYAVTPEHAGILALRYLKDKDLPLKDEEVIDIEENAFRRDEIITKVYGYLSVPYDESHLQNLKSPTPQSDEAARISAALDIIDRMEEDVYYIIGSGSTVAPVMLELGLNPTLLGVDIIRNKQIVKKDVYEQEILDIIGDQPAKLVVTPMGGQGYLFGRGNHQLSDKVLSKLDKEDIIIVATPGKLNTLKGQPLLVYTGNRRVDEKLAGYHKVLLGYHNSRMYKVSAI